MNAYPSWYDDDMPEICVKCDRDCDEICEALRRIATIKAYCEYYIEKYYPPWFWADKIVKLIEGKE